MPIQDLCGKLIGNYKDSVLAVVYLHRIAMNVNYFAPSHFSEMNRKGIPSWKYCSQTFLRYKDVYTSLALDKTGIEKMERILLNK